MSHTDKHQLDVSLPIAKVVNGELVATESFESYLYDISLIAGAVSDVASADATDLPTTLTLVNEIKARLNELLANLRESGKIDE